jgi:hypothetical protein
MLMTSIPRMDLDKEQAIKGQLAVKAVNAVGHLLMAQNPKAVFPDDDDWVTYLLFVRDWANTQQVNGE